MHGALLFDLDGTLLHSDPIHMAVFMDMFGDRGLPVDDAFYKAHVHGRLNADIFAEFLPDESDPQALSEAKEAEFRRRLPRPYPAMPGSADLVARAQSEGWGLAVVTNAMRLNADAMLDAIGLRDAFEIIVIGEECARAKPDPMPYLMAMEALGVQPHRCVAFEDSPSGTRAAQRSGAWTVGVRSSLPNDRLREAGARATIQDFTDPALDSILARLEGAPTP
ncbi:MAG: HAD family phosphatase [Pseudomonadota bacterium]